MKFSKFFISAAFICCTAGVATAQHADISPYVSGGQIFTNGYEDATSTTLPGLRIFAYDFQEEPEDPYFITDPGFNAFAGSGLPAGSKLKFNILDGGSFGLPSNLTFWDGAGQVDFGTTPNGETLELSLGSSDITVGSTTGQITGFSIGTIAGDGSIHKHLNSFLNGLDEETIPTEGIYLLSMELTSDDNTITDSLPLFIVYNNGLSEELHDDAIAYVESAFVPEPTSLSLIGLGAAMLLRRRR